MGAQRSAIAQYHRGVMLSKGTQVAEKVAPAEDETVAVEQEPQLETEAPVIVGETVDVDKLNAKIAEQDEQIFILGEMLNEYQQKHANEQLAAVNLRAALKLERERSNTAASR